MDAWATPDLTVIELAIAIVCTRRPLSTTEEISAEITRWFGNDIRPAHVEVPLRRLVAREDVVIDGDRFASTDKGRSRAETAAQSLVHLFFRDRYFFDVGKLLDVTLVKEDNRHAQ
jgi:hypothetical protein